MKIPSKIDIKGSSYRIFLIKKEEMPDNAAGLCNTQKKAIALSNDLKGKQLEQIFLHELIHAVTEEVGLTQASISDDAFEIISEAISTFIIDRFDLRLKDYKGGIKMAKSGKKGGGKKGK